MGPSTSLPTVGTAQIITAATTDSGVATAVANQTANGAQVTDGPSVTVERHNLFQPEPTVVVL